LPDLGEEKDEEAFCEINYTGKTKGRREKNGGKSTNSLGRHLQGQLSPVFGPVPRAEKEGETYQCGIETRNFWGEK